MRSITLKELSLTLGCEYQGDGETLIEGVSSLDSKTKNTIVMVSTSAHIEGLKNSSIAAILYPEGLETSLPGITHKEPRILLAKILEYFHPESRPEPGIHENATVDSRAEVHPSAYIGPFSVVGPNVSIAADVILEAYVVVGQDSKIGPGTTVQPHVVIGKECQIGGDCQFEAWSKLGERVKVGHGVDLGAHSNLGRECQVQDVAKIDNLVLIGERSVIGPCSMLIGQAAVDKDAILHAGVVVAGQSTVDSGAELCSGVQIGSRSLVVGKLEKAGPYIGNPAIPMKEELKRRAIERRAAREARDD